ncbi:MAG: bifunctional metallophosphatase/5'-nucleotidase [Kofleriaceae bacterium]|nr:bifunctional metallophosphatase/5'-nucleotidase [Kofleriaceae bacterium]
MRAVGFIAAAMIAACGTPPTRQAAAPKRASLLFFADTHAQLEEHPELFWDAEGRTEVVQAGGYARLARAIADIRREVGGRALVIDGGDTFQGSGPAAWSKGDVVIAPQRALGVDLAVPGNWEVAYGAARMRELLGATGYPVLAANLVDDRDNSAVYPATLVRNVGGIRIGFVGVTDPDVPVRQSPAYSKGLRYLPAETIAPHVAALRGQVDVVVLVAHVGLAKTLALVDRVPGIDLVLSGDTHERLRAPVRRGETLVVEPGAFASFLGRVDIELVPGRRPTFEWQLLELRADRYAQDPGVAQIVEEALRPWKDDEQRVIGQTAIPLERYGVIENSADYVLADSLRATAGTDIALSNGFRFGYPIETGPIRERDLWMLYPVSTRLRVGTVTGRQLRAFWEDEIDHVFADDPRRLFGGWLPRVSGMTVRFRVDRPRGERVTAIAVHGEPLDDAREYSLVACEREGDAADALCRIRGVANARTLEVDIHTAIRKQLAARGVIRVVERQRVVAEDLPARVFSQYERR